MASIHGRGFPAPTHTVEFSVAGVFIRIDDELNPEAWLQLFIPWEEYHRWNTHQAMQQEFAAIVEASLLGDPPAEIPELPQLEIPDPPPVNNAEDKR
jgi:hypothetical protein